MKKIVTIISSICICITLVGCTNNGSAKNNISNTTFNESKAISMVIKNHPDFPSNIAEPEIKKLNTGGLPGTTATVKFTTKIEKAGEDTYVVTLTKDWGISVKGKYVKSYWKYNVTPK